MNDERGCRNANSERKNVGGGAGAGIGRYSTLRIRSGTLFLGEFTSAETS